jgi:hypothetical protein
MSGNFYMNDGSNVPEPNDIHQAATTNSSRQDRTVPKGTNTFLNLLRSRRVNSALSEEGEKYKATLEKHLKSRDIVMVGLELAAAFVVHNGKRAVVLYFQEHYPEIEREGNFDVDQRIMETFIEDKLYDNMEFVDRYMITPADYTRAEHMANYLTALLLVDDDAGFTIHEMQYDDSRTNQYSIDTNPSAAIQFCNSYSPCGTIGPMDIAITPCLREEVVSSDPYRHSEKDYKTEPIGCIGGYFEIVQYRPVRDGSYRSRRRTDEPELQVIIHISEAQSLVPSVKSYAYLTALFADQIFNHQLWHKPFLAPNGFDIGRLILGPDGQPLPPLTEDMIQDILETKFADPLIVQDIPLGRPGIPMMPALADTGKDQRAVIEKIEHFLDVPLSGIHSMTDPQNGLSTIIGTCTHGGNVTDIRRIGLFTLLEANKPLEDAMAFQSFGRKPIDRLQFLQEHMYHDAKASYFTWVVPIEPDVVTVLAQELKHLNIRSSDIDSRVYNYGNAYDRGVRFAEGMSTARISRSRNDRNYLRGSRAYYRRER